jgi:hypothetical protein
MGRGEDKGGCAESAGDGIRAASELSARNWELDFAFAPVRGVDDNDSEATERRSELWGCDLPAPSHLVAAIEPNFIAVYDRIIQTW